MLRIAFSTLAARKSGTFGAFAAVALAVVLVVSCGILLESSLRAPIPVERLSAASIVVQGDPSAKPAKGEANVSVALQERRRVSARLAARLRGLPDITAVVAERSVYAQALDRRGRLIKTSAGATTEGLGWSSAALTPYTVSSGHAPRGSGELVLDARVAARGRLQVGDRVRVLTNTSPKEFTVAGIATAQHELDPARQPPIFFQDDVAARLSGTGDLVDLLAILTRPGADVDAVARRVRSTLDEPHLRVLTGKTRGEAEAPEDALAREDIVAGLTVFGVLAGFIAVFVVAGTFALSVQQRHRELALFRAIGTTPRQVRRMVAGEALLISLLAFVVGAPIGVLAAHLEQGLFTRAGMIPEGLKLTVGWVPLAVGLATALVTTQLAAFVSARRASRIRPTDALREAAVQSRPVSWVRGLAGLVVLAGGLAALIHLAGGSSRGSDAPAATMVLMVAAAILGPLLALPFTWLLGGPVMAVSRAPGMLAHANTRANLRRAASVATPVMLAVSLICTILFAKSALQEQTTEQTGKRLAAGYVLRAQDAPGLPPAVANAARALPAVAQASGSIATSVVVAADGVNLRSFPARGVDAGTLPSVLSLGLRSGSFDGLEGRALAVGADSARAFGWHVGDKVDLWLGDGTPARLRVAAVYARPLGFGDVVLPRVLVQRHVTSPLDDEVFVKAAPGADEADLLTHLRALARTQPTVKVLTRAQYQHELEAEAHKRSLAVYVLLAVIGLFCAMALVNAMTMATSERAREFALLRLVGASKRQVRSMIRAETLIMIAFGLTVGSIIAAPGLIALDHGLTGSTVPSVPIWTYAALLAAYALVGFAATVIPTRLALRMDPIRAMAARE